MDGERRCRRCAPTAHHRSVVVTLPPRRSTSFIVLSSRFRCCRGSDSPPPFPPRHPNRIIRSSATLTHRRWSILALTHRLRSGANSTRLATTFSLTRLCDFGFLPTDPIFSHDYAIVSLRPICYSTNMAQILTHLIFKDKIFF